MRIGLTRHAAALGIAVAADLLQLPLSLAALATLLSGFGLFAAVPIEAVDLTIDLATAGIMYGLLGFHWLLLPTAILEGLPVVAAAPTWTACVLLVIWRKRRPAGGHPQG